MQGPASSHSGHQKHLFVREASTYALSHSYSNLGAHARTVVYGRVHYMGHGEHVSGIRRATWKTMSADTDNRWKLMLQ